MKIRFPAKAMSTSKPKHIVKAQTGTKGTKTISAVKTGGAKLPILTTVSNALYDPRLANLPKTYANFRQRLKAMPVAERTVALSLLTAMDRNLATLNELVATMAAGNKTGNYTMSATATAVIAARAKKTEAFTTDPHVEEIRKACRANKFSSEQMNKITRICQKICDAYEKAGWAGDDDWPFYATVVIDTINNEGADSALEMVKNHFKTEMSKSLTQE